jgi:hypothetical protein
MSKTSLKKFLLRRPERFTVEWKWDEGAPGEVRGDEVALVSLTDPPAPALAPHLEADQAEEVVGGSAKEPSAVLPSSGTVPLLEKQEEEEEVALRAHPSAASEALPPEAEEDEDEDEDAIEAILKAAEAEEEEATAAAAAQNLDEVAAYLSENPRTNMQALGYYCKISQSSLKEIVLRQGLTLTRANSRTLRPFSINLCLFVIEATEVIVQRSLSSRLS